MRRIQMKKKPIAFLGTSILLFSSLLPTGTVFAESYGLEQKGEQTEQSDKTLESVQSDITIPERTEAETPDTDTEASSEEQTQSSSEDTPTDASEEALIPSMVLKRKEEKTIKEDQKFALEMFGNLKEAKLYLPEGLAFDGEDNLVEEKPSEDFSWNEEKRELTIKNIADEAAAKTFTLTAEKAGSYELSLFDEETNYESEKLVVAVEEKEAEKEKEESKEATEETTESNKEEKDPEKTATKAKPTPKAASINVGLQAEGTFRTYTDPVSGIAPTEYAVAVPLSISTAGITGAKVEIPYGFTPDPSNPNFEHFTMTDPIFSFIDPGSPAADSIVDHYEDDTTNQKLIIHLKTTKTTVETVNLRFKFNPDYDAKIPVDQVIWQDLQATAYDSADTQLSQSSKVQVKSSTRDGVEVIANKSTPSGEEYKMGAVGTTIRFRNDYYKYSLIDDTADNKFYAQIPTGSTEISTFISYFDGEVKTNADDPTIPIGYTRYYRSFNEDSSTFNYINYLGNLNSMFHLDNFYFTPPTTLNDGDQFHIEIGAIYKKFNGEVVSKTARNTFTKQAQKDWELTSGNKDHNTGDTPKAIVNQNDLLSVSKANLVFGSSNYYLARTVKNTGKRDIKNVRFELYQKNSKSEKLNFRTLYIYGLTMDSSSPKCYYRTDFEIVNSNDKTSRTESSTINKGGHSVILPILSANEYINKVTVVPMGSSGTDEGSWSKENSFGISYTARPWVNDEWPDGTAIPTNKTSTITLGATMFYDDETDDQAPVATESKMNDGVVYYVPGQAVDSHARFVSSNSNSRQPGDTVNYEIQGYNGLDAVGNIINPEVTVAIPRVLEMQEPNTAKDFYDVKNGVNYPGVVNVSLIGSDATNNYYRFKATGTGYMNNTSLSFKIPVSFKVASGTPVGTYSVPFLAISSDNFIQSIRSTNTLSDTNALKLGYDNSVENSYTGITAGHTALSIVYASKLNGDTAGRSGSSDSWTETTHFSVDKNSTPQMKATVSNTGNTSFNNVRLYDILPSSADGRGSNGNIGFTGLADAGGTVYYTTQAIDTLPDYSSDLQTWNAAKLSSHGFSTATPGDMKAVTAIYIDFGTKVVAPNETLDTVMNFLVPDADNQKAVNQFQYSAKEVGSGTTLNAKSSEITFSTEIAKVTYDEALPSFLASGVTSASNMPTMQSVLLDSSGNGSITLSDNVPTLSGYTFVKWQDKSNASKDYQPGAKINFTSSSTALDLKAIWKAVSVGVAYKKNDGTTDTVDTKSYDFGDTVDLTAVAKPTRTGYKFKGWGTTPNETAADFVDGTTVDFTVDKTVYAIWEANAYTVQFESNGGTGTVTDQTFTYDVAGNLKENTFTRPGYQFSGWAKASNAVSADYVDKASVMNLSSAENGTVKLYAVWAALDQTIQFDVNGGDIASKPADIVKKTDQEVEIDKVKAPTRTGYTFNGWYKDSNEITGTIKMPAGGMTLKAEWIANQYTIQFDANKGTGTMASQQLTYDAEQKLTANSFTRSGYTFVGWATSKTGSSAYVDEQNVKNLTAKNNETITLYAVWSASPQVLQFDVNGGDVDSKPANITSTTDAEVDLTTVKAPTRTGYKFTGWYDGADKVGDSIIMPVGGKILRAEWEAISYKVNFDANTGSGTMDKQTFVYDVEQNLAKNTYTKPGYQFEGWRTSAKSLTCDYLDEQTVKNLCTTHDDELTVYAVWRALDQTVMFDVNGGDPATKPKDIVQVTDSTVDLSMVKAPTRTGYTFAGWYEGATKAENSFVMPAGGKTLKAEWTPISYTITFDKNSGTGTMADQAFEYDQNQSISKNAFTKAGYSFTGWSTKKDGAVDYEDEQAVMNLSDTDGAKITLYANWQADDQTVKFDVNGGDEATKPADIIGKTGEKVDISQVKAPTRSGYTFEGWYVKDKKSEDVFEMPAGGVTLVAKWAKKEITTGGAKTEDKDSGVKAPQSESTYRSYFGGRYYSNKADKEATSAKNLPKTGSEQHPLSAILGLCVLAGSSFLLWIRRSKKEEEK